MKKLITLICLLSGANCFAQYTAGPYVPNSGATFYPINNGSGGGTLPSNAVVTNLSPNQTIYQSPQLKGGFTIDNAGTYGIDSSGNLTANTLHNGTGWSVDNSGNVSGNAFTMVQFSSDADSVSSDGAGNFSASSMSSVTAFGGNGNIVAQGQFQGSGAGLTSISDAALSANVSLMNIDNSFTGNNSFIASSVAFYQLFLQNLNNGSGASADFVVGNDRANLNSTSNYVDLGINSSTFVNTGGLSGGPNDSYLYAATNSTNLLIGTQQSNGVVRFWIGTSNPLNISSNAVTFGANTNVSSFTIITTNWISGQLYTNLTGRPIEVTGNVVLTTAGVAGFSQMALRVNGVVTNYSSVLSAVAGLTGVSTNSMSPAFVPNGGIFTWTNTSSGAGDASGTYGGQYIVQ